MKIMKLYRIDELSEDVQKEVIERTRNKDSYKAKMQKDLCDYLEEVWQEESCGLLHNTFKNHIVDVEPLAEYLYYDKDDVMFARIEDAYAYELFGDIFIEGKMVHVNIFNLQDNVNLKTLAETFELDIQNWIINIDEIVKNKRENFIKDYMSDSVVKCNIDNWFTEDGKVVEIYD